MAKAEFEKIFGTTKASRKNWDYDVKPVKVKKHKGKKKSSKKDLFGRKTSDKKKKNKKRKGLEKAIEKAIPNKKDKSDAWLQIDPKEISNLKDLIDSELSGVFRVELQIPEKGTFQVMIMSDGHGTITTLNGKGEDFCHFMATFLSEGQQVTDTDLSTTYDKLTNGRVFRSIEFLNTSLIIEI